MESCLYEGRVRHRRWSPVQHAFEFPLFMVYLDLDELPGVFRGRWLWSTERPAFAWFRRRDHLGDPALPLARCVRDLVEKRCGRRPLGPIRLLTHLRYGGFGFNPVSFYYCFEPDGRRIEVVVAEVTNTPWGERHCSVLASDSASDALCVTTPKEFHVSPFMCMDLSYVWTLPAPGQFLSLRIVDREPGGEPLFDAALALERREITGRSLARALVRHPFITAQGFAAIYWQALRLWRKGAPFHPHPGRAEAAWEGTA